MVLLHADIPNGGTRQNQHSCNSHSQHFFGAHMFQWMNGPREQVDIQPLSIITSSVSARTQSKLVKRTHSHTDGMAHIFSVFFFLLHFYQNEQGYSILQAHRHRQASGNNPCKRTNKIQTHYAAYIVYHLSCNTLPQPPNQQIILFVPVFCSRSGMHTMPAWRSLSCVFYGETNYRATFEEWLQK